MRSYDQFSKIEPHLPTNTRGKARVDAAGDVLMVTHLDRLAQSTRDLLNTLATLTESDAGFRSLDDTWADTTTPHGRLMLTILGGLAEFERELIHARTSEGRERAKAQGLKMARPSKLVDLSATKRSAAATKTRKPLQRSGAAIT